MDAIFTSKCKNVGPSRKKETDSLPGKFQHKRPRGFGGLRWLGRLRARSAPARLCGVRLWAGLLVRFVPCVCVPRVSLV